MAREAPERREPAPEDASGGPRDRTWRGQPVPPGMVLPSRTQYHGTMYGLIALGVVVTLTLAVLVNKGVGPFTVTGTHVRDANGALSVVAQVQNQGDHAGRGRCVATWTDVNGGAQQSAVVPSGVIQPGGTAEVAIPLVGLLVPPNPVKVDCK